MSAGHGTNGRHRSIVALRALVCALAEGPGLWTNEGGDRGGCERLRRRARRPRKGAAFIRCMEGRLSVLGAGRCCRPYIDWLWDRIRCRRGPVAYPRDALALWTCLRQRAALCASRLLWRRWPEPGWAHFPFLGLFVPGRPTGATLYMGRSGGHWRRPRRDDRRLDDLQTRTEILAAHRIRASSA